MIVKMHSLRQAIVSAMATMLVCAAPASVLKAQTPTDPRFKTTAEMATAIAHTIDASLPKTTDGPINFQSATSRENIVEIIYTIRDAAALAKLKASVDKSKRDTASYYCKGERLSYINAGVVIRIVVAASDGHDRVETTIDRSACASLPPPPKLADSKTLIEMARTVAQAENDENASKPPTNGPFHFEAATAHESIVEVRFSVADAAVGQRISANRVQVVGLFQGSSCFKHGDDLRRGLSLHYVFVLKDDSPVMSSLSTGLPAKSPLELR
jgi:hypothetical protein